MHLFDGISETQELEQNLEFQARTLCPSGLRGWTQRPLAQAAWVQIPQVSFFIERATTSLEFHNSAPKQNFVEHAFSCRSCKRGLPHQIMLTPDLPCNPLFGPVCLLEALGVGYFLNVLSKRLPCLGWADAHTPTPQSSISLGQCPSVSSRGHGDVLLPGITGSSPTTQYFTAPRMSDSPAPLAQRLSHKMNCHEEVRARKKLEEGHTRI